MQLPDTYRGHCVDRARHLSVQTLRSDGRNWLECAMETGGSVHIWHYLRHRLHSILASRKSIGQAGWSWQSPGRPGPPLTPTRLKRSHLFSSCPLAREQTLLFAVFPAPFFVLSPVPRAFHLFSGSYLFVVVFCRHAQGTPPPPLTNPPHLT